MEEGEEGELEEQGLHAQVAGQAVQQAHGAVVGAGAVLGIAPQQQGAGADHGGAGEPGPPPPELVVSGAVAAPPLPPSTPLGPGPPHRLR